MLTILWLGAALAALYLIAGLIIFLLACRRFPDTRDPMRALTHATDRLLAPYAEQLTAARQWLQNHPATPVEMTSFDGLTLRGTLYEHPQAEGVLVACHGYRSNGVRDFAAACEFYADYHMSILLIDQRASGKSEGKYITFGVKERIDARDWCALMTKHFPNLPIVLAGISMGAAAVLMAADDLPEAVSALLADCGYTSPKEELRYVARHYVGPGASALLPGIDFWCRSLGGFGLGQCSGEAALSKSSRPVLFIHGQADELVPHDHSIKNRAACKGPTMLFSVPSADHGMSYLVDTDGYSRVADKFIRSHVLKRPAP